MAHKIIWFNLCDWENQFRCTTTR